MGTVHRVGSATNPRLNFSSCYACLQIFSDVLVYICALQLCFITMEQGTKDDILRWSGMADDGLWSVRLLEVFDLLRSEFNMNRRFVDMSANHKHL
jgi:hypothetical protein